MQSSGCFSCKVIAQTCSLQCTTKISHAFVWCINSCSFEETHENRMAAQKAESFVVAFWAHIVNMMFYEAASRQHGFDWQNATALVTLCLFSLECLLLADCVFFTHHLLIMKSASNLNRRSHTFQLQLDHHTFCSPSTTRTPTCLACCWHGSLLQHHTRSVGNGWEQANVFALVGADYTTS